jgi:chitinase
VAAGPAPTPRPAGVIIGYVFARDGLLDPATIPGARLTHINYAFANIQDGVVVEGFKRDVENYKILAGLRQKYPHLKILVSVGGWTWSGNFSDASLTAESRQKFVESAVAFVRRHDLDGFDVDWEYPGLPGYGNINRPEDKENFSALLSELRAALDKAGAEQNRHYLLTFAAGASQSFLDHSQMDVVQGVVDYVNLMTYDFREAEGEPLAGHHSNLFVNPADNHQMSADRAVRAFLAAGVPARKLVLGVPFYGRVWGGVDTRDEPLYRAGGPPKERVNSHYDHLATLAGGSSGWVRKWDASAQMPYLWNAQNKTFIAFDDPESLRVKARYIRERGLAGAMFWELFADRTGALLDTLATELR